MMRKGLLAATSAVGAGIVACAVFIIAARRAPASLEFSVRDAQSGSWVWDLTARLQDRYTRGFYQSDAGPVSFRLTSLAPGEAVLDLSAPSYQDVRVPVRLIRGPNRLSAPVLMRGLVIPGLDRFIAFEEPRGADMVVQLRPVGSDGKAILNHPCLPLWVGATIYTEVKDGAPVRDETERNPARGRELFHAPLAWHWDPTPETQFRYTALIPGAAVAPDPAPLRVIDYLVVVPDPLKIAPEEMAGIMTQVWGLPSSAAREQALNRQKGRLSFFTDTSWNVKAGGS